MLCPQYLDGFGKIRGGSIAATTMVAKNSNRLKFGKWDIIGFAIFGVFYFSW